MTVDQHLGQGQGILDPSDPARLPQSVTPILNDPSNAGAMELLRAAELGLSDVGPVDYRWALRRQVEHIRSVEEAFQQDGHKRHAGV